MIIKKLPNTDQKNLSIFHFATLLIFVFLSCGQKVNDQKKISSTNFQERKLDVFPFKDSSNYVELSQINDTYITVKLIDKRHSLLTDTLKAFKLEYDTSDFNKDGVPDLLILKTLNQSNPLYYLYLIDSNNNELHFVKGFEQVPTPQFEKNKNLIVGYMRDGTQIKYSFYKLNKEKLIDLHLGFDADNEDQAEKKYKEVIRKAPI